jgi:folate-binding protein YgfZ
MKLSDEEFEIYQHCREDVAATILQDYSLIKFTGNDHLQFLQGQSTNDILSLKDGQGQLTAILDPKAKVRTLATVYRCEACLYMLLPTCSRDAVYEHLQKYIVMDEVEMEKLSYELLLISGPKAKQHLEKYFETTLTAGEDYEHQQVNQGPQTIYLSCQPSYGEEGYLFFIENARELLQKFNQNFNLPLMSNQLHRTMSIESGQPKFGTDVDEKTLFPETNLQAGYISYNKGCFVGQEIVARVKYRGSVNKALMGLIFDDEPPAHTGEFSIRGQKGGRITSITFSPHLGKYIALAYIQKKHRAPENRFNLELDDQNTKARVALLPFYLKKSDREEAEDLYHLAIEKFSQTEQSDNAIAEKLLRKAISKNPKFADAYEALGVLLSREQRYDEAIELMKQLKEINPEEVMAYSNLSLFYMKKGMIPEAEEEKAAATAAGFKKTAKDRQLRIKEEQYLKQQKDDAQQKVGMFQQVLEIDKDDLIANFGMGKALLDSDQAQKAIPYLKKCLDVKKDYSVAYLQLGLAQIKIEDRAQARITLKAGIECATQKGDLMPRNEMQRYLDTL